jgi:hypothetical protein
MHDLNHDTASTLNTFNPCMAIIPGRIINLIKAVSHRAHRGLGGKTSSCENQRPHPMGFESKF